jgi:hypothetical protein
MKGLSLLLLCSCWPGGLDLTPNDNAGEGDPGTLPPGGSDASDDGSGGAGGSGTDGGDDGGGTFPAPDSTLSPARQLARVSIALRGIPPTSEDFAAIASDPTRLSSFVDAYLYDPAFLETIKDAYAERLLLRQDQVIPLSDDGAMGAYSESEAFTMFESPLQLIAHVVDEDRRFTDIVTTDDLWVNEPMSEAVGGAWQSGEGEWQRQDGWGDDRPEAGLLSNSMLWIRHQSVGSNDQRGRANVVADALLCEAFTDRDVDIDGTIDLGSEDAILDAVFTNENCLACHQALEPLASNFWGYQKAYNAIGISVAFQTGCDTQGDNCYPLNEYRSEDVDVWYYKDLRAPGYYGREVEGGLAELGSYIASDPRFAQCVVRTVYGYLAQMDRSAVPLETVASYQQLFEDSNFNVRALTKAIVLSPEFLLDGNGSDGTVGLLSMRPEAIGRTVESLTGFVWRAGYDDEGCHGFDCYGTVDLVNNDNFGFRAMMGGVDGMYVTSPVWDTTPTRLLAVDALVSEAAAWVVTQDLQESDLSQRTLLTQLTNPVLAADVKTQLAGLYFRFYGEPVDVDGAEVALLNGFFADAYDGRGGNVTEAWTLTVAAMLQDPALLFY